MEVSEDIVDRLHIDETNLDKGCLEQPSLTGYIQDLYTDAQHEATKAEAQLKFIKARLYKNISDDPRLYGISKLSVDATNAAIERTPEYQEKKNEFIDLQYKANKLQGYVFAVANRKAMLQELVSLFKIGYFSEIRETE